MKINIIRLSVLAFLLGYNSIIFSQTTSEKRKIIKKTNVTNLLKISEFQKEKSKKDRALALAKAKIEGWQVVIKDTINHTFSELIRLDNNQNPIYFTTHNYGAGLTARNNHLYAGGSLGLNIEGQNMLAGEWDSGGVRYTHELLNGRVTQMDTPISISDHATHVAGTIIGTDQVQNGNARGMAFKANLNAYDWYNDRAEVSTAASNGLLISNHSYGYKPNLVPLYLFGKYDFDALVFDDIMYNAPYYLFVASAGNSRIGGYNTADAGYDLLTGHACSKNSMVVAAVSEQTNYNGPASVIMSSFSSWGPTDDGRIKPDIAAKGVNTFSAIGTSNNSYDVKSGTSMASPSITGSLLLLQQYYNEKNNNFMLASTLRGLTIHAADEAGNNPGPDYEYGWGLINTKKAASIIKNDGVTTLIDENALNQGGTFTMTFKALGTEPLMATICWTDPASPNGLSIDNTEDYPDKALVNDLDIRITKDGVPYYPWKLDPNNPSDAATNADNNTDNIEKIQINNPVGTYTLTVTHKGNLMRGYNSISEGSDFVDHQNFSLILSGVAFNDFYLTTSNEQEIICEGDNTATINLNFNTIIDYNNDTVNFSALGLPTGVNASFSPSSLNTAGNFDLTLTNLSNLSSGTYPFIVQGQSSTETVNVAVELQVLDTNFTTLVLNSPLNNANSVLLNTNFEWSEDPMAEEYEIEIATDASFTNIIETATVTLNSYQATLLNNSTTYYWRVRSKNRCGLGSFTNPFSFTTTCEIIETIDFCDITTIDFDNNGEPDGIINLYDEYNAIPGVTPISITDGVWYDPDYTFALATDNSGNLSLWDISTSSIMDITHQFQLINDNSTCTEDGVIITLNVIIGPFSGIAVPTVGNNDVNVEICDVSDGGCFSTTFFDLYQTFLSVPSPHTNGIWTYNGNSPNFVGILDNRYLIVNIPYDAGPPLVDEETFELTYTVAGTSPCSNFSETTVKVSAIRGVFAGNANTLNIGESEIINGDYDNDINLLDDAYLVKEDIEGIWLVDQDTTGQLDNPLDSFINLKEIYDDLLLTNPRFGCIEYTFSYFVNSRPSVCYSSESTIKFRLFEEIRPFSQGVFPEYCVNHTNPSSVNLYDLLEFTDENNVIYDYPPKVDETEWKFISGPSNLGLDTFSGQIDISNITNADAGTYVFEYNVFKDYFCKVEPVPNGIDINPEIIYNTPSGCYYYDNFDHPSHQQTAQVTLVIHPYKYPGEDTSNIEFCESEITNPIDLFTLLETNDVDTIYQGNDGVWYNVDTDENISNMFVVPAINQEQTFNFEYHIDNGNCDEQSSLSFTVFQEYNAGEDAVANVCIDDENFELFDLLNGSPDDNGLWSGPNGFTSTSNSVDFNPENFESGDYVYTVPSNGLCEENSATVTVNIQPLSNAGDNVESEVCKLDEEVDLTDLLDADADLGGTFIDVDNTNSLTGSIVNLSILNGGSYQFQYNVQPNLACAMSSSIITLIVNDVQVPQVDDQSFCVGYGATISDLELVSTYDTFNWYANLTDEQTLNTDLILQNGEDYFLTAVNENNCESERVKITVTLLEFGQEGCVSCVNDGVSANNDNLNETLELCDLPSIFPNFEIKIFNRYGNIIYIGNKNTTLFDGTSNVPLTLGNQVPSGVYFYIFNPNDGNTKPFQGDFYLSR